MALSGQAEGFVTLGVAVEFSFLGILTAGSSFMSRVVQLWGMLDAARGWQWGEISLPLIKEAALKEVWGELCMIYGCIITTGKFSFS